MMDAFCEKHCSLEQHSECNAIRDRQDRKAFACSATLAEKNARGMSPRSGVSRALLLLLSAVGFASLTPTATAQIFPYDGMELEPSHLVYRESGMFAPGKGFLEIAAGRGDGESFIRLSELKFEAPGTGLCHPSDDTCIPQEGHVELAIFEQQSFGHVGVVANNTRYYCCDDSAIYNGACMNDQAGTLLLSDSKDIWWNRRIELQPGIPNGLEHNDLYRIPETGMYVVLMGNCDPATDVLLITGHSEWKNPYGYLPGEAYGYLPLFFTLAVVYLCLGIVWMVVCMAYIKDLLAIQMWASLVLLLGMIETGSQYFDYRDWNMEGSRSPGAQSFGILFGAAKRALSLSLVLMVCMGYGVVRPSLGRDVHRIMGMALVYFVSSAMWVALSHSSGEGDKDFGNRTGVNASAILVFVNSTIMVFFYMWIIQSIFGVIQHLRSRRQEAKLQLYLQFRLLLGGSAVCAVLWATYGLIRFSEDETQRHWESYWTVDAIWELFYLSVLLAVCFLLRPSMNTQRFHYSAAPTSSKSYDDDGDILLQTISEEDAEYGGSFDDGEDKDDDFISAGPRQAAAPSRPFVKKANQD